jgi:hypothetical protein
LVQIESAVKSGEEVGGKKRCMFGGVNN